MMDGAMFWTVVKADAIFALISLVFSVALTVIIAAWRKRRIKKAMEGGALKAVRSADAFGPRAFLIGGREPKPGECPLCGRDWPLPGPVLPAPEPKD
jgi:hypothetical protein